MAQEVALDAASLSHEEMTLSKFSFLKGEVCTEKIGLVLDNIIPSFPSIC